MTVRGNRPGVRPIRPRLSVAAIAAALLVGACSGAADDARADTRLHPLFGASEPISAVVGEVMTSSYVVPLQCIPVRVDPVGVFVELEIVGWEIVEPGLALRVRVDGARLGSHPGGCSDPDLVMPSSVFLMDDDEMTILPSEAYGDGNTTTLVFDLDGADHRTYAAVVFPTLEYLDRAGERRTIIYGFVGFYELV